MPAAFTILDLPDNTTTPPVAGTYLETGGPEGSRKIPATAAAFGAAEEDLSNAEARAALAKLAPAGPGQAQLWKTAIARRDAKTPLHIVMGFDSMSSGGGKWPTPFDAFARASMGDAGMGFRSAYDLLFPLGAWVNTAEALTDYAQLKALAPLAADSAFTRYMVRPANGLSAAQSRRAFAMPGVASRLVVWYAERYSGLPVTFTEVSTGAATTIYTGNTGGTAGGAAVVNGTAPLLKAFVIPLTPQTVDHRIEIEIDTTAAGATANCVLYGLGAWNPNVAGVITHQCALSGGNFSHFLNSWDATARATWFSSTSPDLAVTIFGTNDGASAEGVIQAGAEAFLAELRARRPDIAVGWVGPLLPADYVANGEKIGRAVRAAIATANAGAALEFAWHRDLSDLYTSAEGIAAGLLVAPGDVHPSTEGYRWMGSAVWHAIGGATADRFAVRSVAPTPLNQTRFNRSLGSDTATAFQGWTKGASLNASSVAAGLEVVAPAGYNPATNSGNSSIFRDSLTLSAGEPVLVVVRCKADGVSNTGFRWLSGGELAASGQDVVVTAAMADYAFVRAQFASSRVEIRPLDAAEGGTLTIESITLFRVSELARFGVFVGNGVPTRAPASLTERYFDAAARSWYRVDGFSGWIAE